MPPGASALLTASPEDHAAMQAIAKVSSRLGRLIVVSLEGFGEPIAEQRGLDVLRTAKIPVVNCRQGQLREALNTLESVGGLFRTRRSGTVASIVQ